MHSLKSIAQRRLLVSSAYQEMVNVLVNGGE
jgi:hypothetical protein